MSDHDDDHGQVLTPRLRPNGILGRARAQAHLDTAELLEANRQVLDALVGMHRLTAALEQMVSFPRRRVLWSGTATFDVNGRWTQNLQGARAIYLVNYTGNGNVTVHAGVEGGSAPGPGPGVHNVPAGVAAAFNNESNDWTLYGTAGQNVDVQIFGVAVQPSAAGNI